MSFLLGFGLFSGPDLLLVSGRDIFQRNPGPTQGDVSITIQAAGGTGIMTSAQRHQRAIGVRLRILPGWSLAGSLLLRVQRLCMNLYHLGLVQVSRFIKISMQLFSKITSRSYHLLSIGNLQLIPSILGVTISGKNMSSTFPYHESLKPEPSSLS